MSIESTTWAASVPADLTDIIAAAVGVQPVRAQAPFKLPVLQHPASPNHAQPSLSHTAATGPAENGRLRKQPSTPDSNRPKPECSSTLGDSHGSCGVQPPLAPIRRPTLAEVQAASHASAEHTASSLAASGSCDRVVEQHGSNSQADRSCQHTLQQVQPVNAACQPQSDSSRARATVFDNMDDVQVPYGQVLSVLQDDRAYAVQLDHHTEHYSPEQWVPSCDVSQVGDTSLSHLQQQQQQLMCQLWSQMQAQQHCEGIVLPPKPVHSNSSSCCSEVADTATCWPLDSSSLGSSSCDMLDSPSGSCTSACSRASSICSRSSTGASEKHVTWGPVIEYQLPPEPKYSLLWDFVPDWVVRQHLKYMQQPRDGGSRRLSMGSTAAGATAVGVVVVAGIAAVVCLRRSASV